MELVLFHGFDAIPGDLISVANAVRWGHPNIKVRLLSGPIVREAGRAWWNEDDPLFPDAASAVEWVQREAGDVPFIVAGFSQGGALALATAFSNTPNVKGVASVSGFMPDDVKLTKIDVPMFIAHGNNDQVVDVFHATSLVRKIDRLGIEHTAYIHDGLHTWTDEVTDEFVRWIGSVNRQEAGVP